jgi:PEP-CTERM motif
MKKLIVLIAAIVVIFSATSAHADLIGSTVHGSLRIDGTGPNLFTSPLTTVTTGNIPEFTDTFDVDFVTKAGRTVLEARDTVSAFFTPNGVLIEDQCTRVVIGGCLLSPAFSVSFRDQDFFPFDIFLFSAGPNFDAAIASGHRLTVDFSAGGPGNLANDSFTSFVILVPAPTPEPSSILLLATGLAGAAGTLRRRIFSQR